MAIPSLQSDLPGWAKVQVPELGRISSQTYTDVWTATGQQVGPQVGDPAFVYAMGHIYQAGLAQNQGQGPVTSMGGADTNISWGAPQLPPGSAASDQFWLTSKYGGQYLRLRTQRLRVFRVVC